jgi:hypothetical protein
MKKLSFYFALIVLSCLAIGSAQSQSSVLEPGTPEVFNLHGSKVNIYPNPVATGASFYIQLDSCLEPAIDKVYIYSEEGYLLKTYSIRLEPGIVRYPASTSGLRQGRYVLRIVGDWIPGNTISLLLDIE